MIKLLWIALIMSTNGPMGIKSEERQRFQSIQECQEYAVMMSPRMADWIRGHVQADWEFPVKVVFRCEAGDPA